MPVAPSPRILVIGAGLGGLIAALALRAQGIDVEVHEAAADLREAGAGLTVSRGAQHVFRALGLQERVAALACPSAALPFLHYRTARLLAGARDPGDGSADDGIADITRHMHRADLQAVLLAACAGLGIPVVLGHRLAAIEADDAGIVARFGDGSGARGDALVGADGVRSVVRALLWGDDPPRFTGQLAYRFLASRADAEPFLGAGRSALFLGPGRTFNRYTLRGGAVLNCVGLAASDAWVGEGWSTRATRDELLTVFDGWHPDVTGLMALATDGIKWGLFDHAPLPRWARGRVTLLGDAAHAMLPFLGLGAAMAIEDGFILARAFAAEGTVDAAFDRYESARRPRTELVHAKSREQGERTQALDIEAYDGSAAPVGDPSLMRYDPVTAVI